MVFLAAYESFLMYSRVTAIDSIHLSDETDLNSPYPPIQNKYVLHTTHIHTLTLSQLMILNL